MKNTIVFLLMIYFAIGAHAQTKKHIKKGRRYKSESQFALKENDLQAEWEVGRETTDSQLTTFVYPNLELHYGLSDRMEVNAELSLITTADKSFSPQKNTTGMEPLLLGVNYQVLRDTYNTPSVIVSAQLAIPFLATKEFTIDHLAPVVQVDVQEAVHNKWIFGCSGGLLWDGFSTSPSFIYNANTSYSFTKKWMITAEYFSFVSHNLPQNNLDASLIYVINDLIQFGASAGAGISSAAPKNYISINGTWGLNTSRKRQSH